MKTIQPDNSDDHANLAADLIRQKLDNLYAHEPSAKEERREADTAVHRSKHQQFMHNLSRSGASLAQIQTSWHNYYVSLPDDEKHEVWEEFYAEHDKRKKQPAEVIQPVPVAADPRSVTEIKQDIVGRVNQQRRVRKKGGHVKSLLFGLSSGLVVIVILLFGFFNERFIAPFISPSRSVSATPIIIDPSSNDVGSEPKIIIPKINVEIPVIYDEPSIEDHAVQAALERGVVHYGTTSNPGQLGNGAVFGHSSNNILNKGKYKFAFVLLKRLEAGDTFILQKDGKRYVYKVFDKKVVKPEDVSVLADGHGKPATFSLITCDPPGTSLNRLVVTGEQITPDPIANIPAAANTGKAKPAILPSNSPSLWNRLTHLFSS